MLGSVYSSCPLDRCAAAKRAAAAALVRTPATKASARALEGGVSLLAGTLGRALRHLLLHCICRHRGVRGLFDARRTTGPGELVFGRCAMVSQRHALTIQRFGCPEACARAPGATAGAYGLEAQSRSAMHATHLLHQRIQECFPESLQRFPQRRSVIVLVLATTLVSCAQGLKLNTGHTSGASPVGGRDVSCSFSSFSKWATVGTACGLTSITTGKHRHTQRCAP